MRRTTTAFALGTLMLAGCSKGGHEESEKASAASALNDGNLAPQGVNVAPNISVTAAPGVAFTYRYAFVLADTAISAVQEQHAAACEALGPQRCRITGMRYTLVDEDEVRGQLEFKLDPALARNFGKQGIAAVERAKGRLIDAEIEGTDVGGAIDQSQRRSQQNGGEIERIEKQLAAPGLGDEERTQLRRQLERLREQQAREQETRDSGEAMLANTPMTFNYAGKRGFSFGDDPISDAWSSGQSSFTTMVTIVLVTVGALLPWAALVALLVLLWRKTPLRHLRLRSKRVAETESDPVPAEPLSPAASPEP